MNSPELQDPFQMGNGVRVGSTSDWARRRRDIRDQIVNIEYGGLPPVPEKTVWEELHAAPVKRLGGARFITGRVSTGPDRPFSFLVQLLVPSGDGPFPVVLNGDACWRYATDAVAMEVLRRGHILAQFNRVELAPDVYRTERVSGLYPVYPRAEFGALAAWAWGYHRCVDVLETLPFVEASRIAVVGHSRGGKASLLAGATDERIALTGANNSGAGGAGSFRLPGPECEKVADLMRVVSYWFGPHMKAYIDRDDALPFDQHFLKCLVAPRALLTTEALDDLWANPTGTLQTHWAAKEVYRFLGAESRIGIRFREGAHGHAEQDWFAFLDFMDWQQRGIAPTEPYDESPFPELRPAFSWKAPVS